MNQIGKGYEMRFRELLRRVGARRVDAGVKRLTSRGERLSRQFALAPEEGLRAVWEHLVRHGKYRLHLKDVSFLCDAGLGGLARWLRAAGYHADWFPELDDAEILKLASRTGQAVLTTDSLMMERRCLRDLVIRGFWLPPSLRAPEQLRLVLLEFDLPLRESKCMDCGGTLAIRDKEQLSERIPPRTYLWLETFFECEQCRKVFWHGTHWDRIRKALEGASWQIL